MNRDAITAENFRFWVRRAEQLMAQRDKCAELVKRALYGGFDQVTALKVLEVIDGDDK